MMSKHVTESGYHLRRMLDLPDWAIQKPNLIYGNSRVGDVEMWQEELIGLYKPRFVDSYGWQVKEENSCMWDVQSIDGYLKHPQNSRTFNSKDQRNMDISDRKYIWSSGTGEHGNAAEQEIIRDEPRDKAASSLQFLSQPLQLQHRNSDYMHTRERNTDTMTHTQLNSEAWVPYDCETPASGRHYQWDPNQYPRQPAENQIFD